jgi:hypothetical protein
MKHNKENRGGKRAGAGPPLKYGEETEVVKFRVPKSKKEIIVDLVHEALEKYKTKKDLQH